MLKGVITVDEHVRVVRCTHHGTQGRRCAHASSVGDAHTGAILKRDPAPRVDGLRLREHEGVALASRLFRGQPLQSSCGRAGLVADANMCGPRVQTDSQGRSEDRVGLPNLDIPPPMSRHPQSYSRPRG